MKISDQFHATTDLHLEKQDPVQLHRKLNGSHGRSRRTDEEKEMFSGIELLLSNLRKSHAALNYFFMFPYVCYLSHFSKYHCKILIFYFYSFAIYS
jgi:hypothetical protein